VEWDIQARLEKVYRLWSKPAGTSDDPKPRKGNKFTVGIHRVASKYELGKGPESFQRVVLVGGVPSDQYLEWTNQGFFSRT
jgi:hypothetical protein